VNCELHNIQNQEVILSETILHTTNQCLALLSQFPMTPKKGLTMRLYFYM